MTQILTSIFSKSLTDQIRTCRLVTFLKAHSRVCDKWKFFKNYDDAFYFMLKALLVPEILKLLPSLFGCVEKRLDKKAMVNFKIYDVIDLTANNSNTQITQCLKKWKRSGNEICSVNKI